MIELTNDQLERLILKERINAEPFLVQAHNSAIITGDTDGEKNVSVQIEADSPLPEELKEDIEEFFKPRFSSLMHDEVSRMDYNFIHVPADHEEFSVNEPFIFIDEISITNTAGESQDLSPVEVVNIASRLELDTPEIWMPPPAGLVIALANEDEEVFEKWCRRMKSAPTRYGSVDHELDVVAMLGSWKNEDEKELEWTL